MRLLKVTKTVRSMKRNEDELNRPVYAPRSASSSAMTKPSCIPASRISVHRRDNSENLSWLLYVEWFFHRCPHSLRMGHRPATLLDVLIPGSVMRSRERAGQTQRQCSNGKACRDNIEQVITLQELRQPPVSHCHQKLHLFLMGSFMETFCLPFIFCFSISECDFHPKRFVCETSFSIFIHRTHVGLFSGCVWGSMGAERGNYAASDL